MILLSQTSHHDDTDATCLRSQAIQSLKGHGMSGSITAAMKPSSTAFDDCWGGLIDFERSDWVNLCEPYTSDLLARWQNDERDVMEMWVSYCEAIGATSSIQALEGECDRWADGDDMNCAIVNHSMTWAAGELLRHLTAWADEHTDHEGPIWDELRRHM